MGVLVLLFAVFFVWLFGFRGVLAVGCCRLCGGCWFGVLRVVCLVLLFGFVGCCANAVWFCVSFVGWWIGACCLICVV